MGKFLENIQSPDTSLLLLHFLAALSRMYHCCLFFRPKKEKEKLRDDTLQMTRTSSLYAGHVE